MDFQDIAALADMLNPEGENDEIVSNPYAGSVFSPGDVGGKQQKEMAKPFSQVAVKGGRGELKNEPTQEQPQQKPKTATKGDKKDIWDSEEIQAVPKALNETRQRPEVTTMFKQAVASEDVFGGWSGIDPSSNTCQFILVKISLPNTKLPEISLDVLRQELVCQSTKYYLHFPLPYPVKDKEGKAKWISDKEVLEITLPIIREEPF